MVLQVPKDFSENIDPYLKQVKSLVLVNRCNIFENFLLFPAQGL